ncbi:MAG TPA: condensation domain-containing protein, partial [Ktedonobacteraceae bacterium]|nr:condensation domain-containing protein [Ktedonobacteraceae bacterium]
IARALQGEQAEPIPPLQAVPRERELPLSFAQQRLWFLDQLDPTNTAYNKSISIQLRGVLHFPALARSLRTIVGRHEVLRTTFSIINDQPVQVIQAEEYFKQVSIDISGLAAEKVEYVAERLAEADGRHLFDLAHDVPIRATLIKLNETTHHLVLTLHHIVSDAWSNGIFVRELNALYAAFAAGAPSPLPALPFQYADFAVWQRTWLRGRKLEEEALYWKKHLEGIVPLELPTDRPRSLLPTFLGETYELALPRSLSEDLRKLSQKEGVTLFMTLLAAFQLLLSRYTQQTDIAVGTPIANRDRAEIENLIGFFVNTLVLRSDLSGNPTFRELLKRVRVVTLGAYTHQDLPFDKLVELLDPERDLSRSPFFRVMFSLQNVPMSLSELPGLQIHVRENERGAAKFDLNVAVVEREQGLFCMVEYFADLFNRSTIERLFVHWQNLMQQIVANPELPLNEISLFSEAELHHALNEWNTTEESIAPELCAPQIFEQIAREEADRVALVMEDECITYSVLDQRANQLAHLLVQHGVGPDVLVGVCLPRSLDQFLAVWAILKAGGASLPLDGTLPQARLAFLLNDAGCSLLLTRSQQVLPPTVHPIRRLHLEQLWTRLPQQPAQAPQGILAPEQLAYVIYTSGSTGMPKGVLVSHQGLGNLAVAQAQTFAMQPGSRELQLASLSFDASVS